MIEWLRSKLKKNLISYGYIAIGVILFLVVCVTLIHRHNQSHKQQNLYESFTQETSVEESTDATVEAPVSSTSTEDIVEEAKEQVSHVVTLDDGSTIDFDSLMATNSDIYAWIYMPDTNVSYPILQHPTDYDYYLEHNVDDSVGRPGCIYTHKPQSKDFTDFATILYGHDWKNGTMFGALRDFYDGEYFGDHEFIYIYTPEKKLSYKIFKAALHSDDYLPREYDNFCEQGINDFIDMLGEENPHSACHDRNISYGPTDKYIVLSTCTWISKTKRYLLIGKLVEEVPLQ